VRINDLDDGLRRAEAMHRAGADVLLVMPGRPEHIRIIADRLPKPLMFLLPTAGITSIDVTIEELWALGYTLVADPATPLFSMARAMRDCYQALRQGRADPLIGASGPEEERHVHAAIGLTDLLEIERATVET
jgi:2-methylisocitrate lyase-like PEP mutase family enzyme